MNAFYLMIKKDAFWKWHRRYMVELDIYLKYCLFVDLFGYLLSPRKRLAERVRGLVEFDRGLHRGAIGYYQRVLDEMAKERKATIAPKSDQAGDP